MSSGADPRIPSKLFPEPRAGSAPAPGGSVGRPWALGLLGLFTLAMVACGPSGKPTRPLPSYTGHLAMLYDDGIEGTAVGFAGEGKNYRPKYDPLFRERSQVADGVVRLKITTIHAKVDTTGTSYVLGCRVEQRLAGAYSPTGDFELRVASTAPSTGILRSLDSNIVGMRFVGFVRSFVRPDGDSELHFHLAPDTPTVTEAAAEAARP